MMELIVFSLNYAIPPAAGAMDQDSRSRQKGETSRAEAVKKGNR